MIGLPAGPHLQQNATSSPLKESLCRRGRVIVAEDKARDRVESGIRGGSATQSFGHKGRTPVCVRTHRQAARMDFFNGLLIRSTVRPLFPGSSKSIMCFAALALLAFVCHAATRSNAEDERTTTQAITT